MTASPSTPFPQIVNEARISYNNTSTANLGNQSPSDLHFFRSNANLMDVDGSLPLSGLTGSLPIARQVVAAKRKAQELVLHNDVRRFVQRRDRENPGDADDKLKVGDLVFKKRTSFWGSVPRKLQFRVDEDAFEIVGKLATNSFQCKSVLDGELAIFPGGQLVRTTLKVEELKALLARMKVIREELRHPAENRSTRNQAMREVHTVSSFPVSGDGFDVS